MPRRWRKVRKDHEDNQPADRAASPRRADESSDRAGRDERVDPTRLSERLEAVSSAYKRPPSADELRAAFGRKESIDDESGPRSEFETKYSAESLFVPTPEPPEEELLGEDRSRTKGDYYYDPDDAWAVLELQPGAEWSEIAAAHRRLAKKHHPDRMLHAPPEEQARAEEAMREINVAYSVLRRLTGR